MAHIEFDGHKVEIIEDWRVGEQVRAQKAMQIDMMAEETTELERMLVVVFMSLRRNEAFAEMQPAYLADLVNDMEFSTFASLEESDPLDVGAEANGAGQEIPLPLTSGAPPSESSE